MQTEVRYLPPHRREGSTLENVAWESPNVAKATVPQRIFTQINPLTQLGAYEGGFSFDGGLGNIMQPPVGMNGNRGQQVQQVPQQPFGQPALVPNLEAIKEAYMGQALGKLAARSSSNLIHK